MLISTTQHKRTISAWMITLIIHALLICILLWWRYQLPSPELKEEELGMEVNLGVDENVFTKISLLILSIFSVKIFAKILSAS